MPDSPHAHQADLFATAVADTLAEITSVLVGAPDSGAVLRLVTNAGMELLGAAATGLMVVDPRGGVEVAAASDEPARFVELLQSQVAQGPCLDCITETAVVTAFDLEAEHDRWPEFVPAALAVGYRAITSIPLPLDSRAVGGLNLLFTENTVLTTDQLRLAQVIADLTVLALVQEDGYRRADRFAERTLTALNDRVHLGQAVGLVAGTLDIHPAAAHTALIGYAEREERGIRDVVRAITDGALDPAELFR
ncbi:GAF domain-containing protein [Actinophytocola glycyrrhizae]|uniref:GAF domain-containing protein n=1 Tax=Actinophytocola glycyrrhizae TaxID=2044873 RepID=A0ABV9S669_9PSEU